MEVVSRINLRCKSQPYGVGKNAVRVVAKLRHHQLT